MKSFFRFTIFTSTILINAVPSWGLLYYTDTLKEVIIIDTFVQKNELKDNLLKDQPGIHLDQKTISLFRNTSIEQFIQQNSSVYIKNLGVNGISTLGIRGASPSQSQVVWQGVPINNIIAGITDISTLSTGIFDNIQIKTTGTATLYGNATIGGALLIHSRAIDQKFGQLQLGAGNFGSLNGLIKYNVPIKNGNMQWKYRANKADNDFPYLYQNKKFNLSNGRRNEHDFMYDYYKKIKLSKKLKPLNFNFNTWFQYNYKEIPPAYFERLSVKNQMENFLRINMDFIQEFNKIGQIQIKNAVSWENNIYQDSIANLNQKYNAFNSYHEFSWQSQPFKLLNSIQSLNLFLPFQNQILNNKISNENYHQAKAAIALVYQMETFNKKFHIQTGIRQEFIQNQQIPLLYNASIKFNGIKYRNFNSPIFSSIQKSYRLPTLPELYIFPGGNSNLKPEWGLNLELGTHPSLSWNDGKISYKISHYNRKIKDWIYWLGVTIWTPYNIAEVYSRGWEHQLNISQNIGNIELYLNTNYTYNISTTEASHLPNNNSIGKQIPYAPRYTLNNSIGLKFRQLWANIQHNYTGYTFTNLDESSFIKPYSIINAQFKYNKSILEDKIIGIQLNLNNIFNTKYETIKYRPMPPVNGNIQISFTW